MNTNQSATMYESVPVVSELNKVQGFDPLKFLRRTTKGEKVLDTALTQAATDVMKGVVTNGTGRGANISNGQPVAGKTGTSENWRDKWFCGITPQLSTAVWIGGRDEVRMPSSVACDGVYGNFMSQVLAGQPIEQFPTSDTKLTYNTTDFGNGSGSTGSSPEHEGDTEMTDGTLSLIHI